MNMLKRSLKLAMASALALGLAGPVLAQNPCTPKPANPCAAKNACAPKAANPHAAKNPCAPKATNPCAAKNPCAAGSGVDHKLVTRPQGTKLATGDRVQMLKLGETLWSDAKLSTNNLSCSTCHTGGAAFQNTFAKPYPHYVAMAKDKGGFKKINLDEMVQLCLVAPMASKTLAWDSKELAALTMYTAQMQKSFKPVAAMGNPCAAKNPCAVKNPCAAKNPCAPKK